AGGLPARERTDRSRNRRAARRHPVRNSPGICPDRSFHTVIISATTMTPAPVKPTISVDILNQIDIRAGTIESVSDVPGSEKLVALRVNFGDHSRTIVAGLKQERSNPREIEGRQALCVVNLEPRKMRGVVSEGML